MKKSVLYLIMLCLSTAMLGTSCRKDYTCQCKDGWGGGPYNVTVKRANHTRASATCNSYNKGYIDGPYDCHLVD